MRIKYLQDASEQDDTQEEATEATEISNEVASSIDGSEERPESPGKLSKESEIEQEEIKENQQTEEKQKETHREEKKEETSDSAELAALTRSASLTTPDDGVPTSVATNELRQVAAGESRTGIPPATIADSDGGSERRSSGHVGEWNSLPILVERLREALELSLAADCRCGDEPTSSSLAEPGAVAKVGDRLRRSMEQAVLGSCDHDPEPKKGELKFLEDLLLLDIQTALSRLRETLERTDITTLTKHGGVSDPTSKLHLLRLVSSLLARLQVPQEEATDENRSIDVATLRSGALSPARRRRAVRHTIGVSAEEIAYARKQLEESSADLARLSELSVFQRQQESPLASAPNNANNTPLNGERHVEEIHDKYTKDAINQRQSLRDKNKDCRGDIGTYRSIAIPSQVDSYADRSTNADQNVESNIYQGRCSVDHQEKENEDEEAVIRRRTNEEQSQVTKLAEILRQRAELAISANTKCNSSNKFAAKKSKIKRANTVDIPSYLKLQTQSFGYDNSGCALLRRPINVGDKVSNVTNVAVPSFHPRTENDKKFLALISRNKENETQVTFNATPAFKSFGYTKATDMSSVTNENWNSRFSNIKTAFDKPTNDENKLSPRSRPATRFPGTSQTFAQVINKKTPNSGGVHNGFPFANVNAAKSDAGFKHAPSSLFRKIEKPQAPKSPPGYHWHKDNAPPSGSTLREKARIMFDRDSHVQSQPTSKFKIDAYDNSQKSSFPRPPWIEHDRNENKSNNMVTENGRLDYRLFCKQFAPFIGKSTGPETKKSQDTEEFHKYDEDLMQRKDFVPSNEKLGVVNGKISLRMFSEKEPPVQYHSSEPHRKIKESGWGKVDHSKDLPKIVENTPIDIVYKNNSSTTQTGINTDNCSEETRMFRVIPKISTESISTCNDAFVQTYNEPERSPTSSANCIESKEEQWVTLRQERNEANSILDPNCHPAKDLRQFVPDQNQDCHVVVSSDVALKNDILPLVNKTSYDLDKDQSVQASNSVKNETSQASNYHPPEQREQNFQMNPQYENNFSPNPTIDNRSRLHHNYFPYVKTNTNQSENQMLHVPYEINKETILDKNSLPEEQNIQNQDISADIGVVTRYTCAIATVASMDTPESRSEGIAADFGKSSSSSPSQFWLRNKQANNELATTEDEIRRHNMLQQSLVRRLQNERVTLNDRHVTVSDQSAKFQRVEVPRRLEPPKKSEPRKKSEPLRRAEPPRKAEPPRRLEPPIVTGLLSLLPTSGSGAVNRVTALREQYEQPSNQLRSVQKERSPIMNGASSAMDSSDEYLVSCSNKPSRSIVLSKSESWHQLALSNNNHHASRLSDGLPPSSSHTSASYLPKPPKPKSPSAFRMKKQYEASSSSDSVRKMEDKIRRYFDNSSDSTPDVKDSKGRRFSSRESTTKGLIALTRSRTMPGICDERLRLMVPTEPQIPMNLNSADVDKVFDDIFEEATRIDDHRF